MLGGFLCIWCQFEAILSTCMLFLTHLMPACRQCCLHACYNACCFLFHLCQFASNAVCMDAYTMQQLVGYNLCLLQSAHSCEVWALSQQGRRKQQTLSASRLTVRGNQGLYIIDICGNSNVNCNKHTLKLVFVLYFYISGGFCVFWILTGTAFFTEELIAIP
jgi:hypothetical protein